MMALNNKFNWLVLTTGNKSEMATGYATLYGDMAGAFAVIKDVPKTLAYELARYRNCQAGYDLIPESVITKEPSAELKPDQLDVDSLPPYDQLDPILQAYVEDDRSLEEIVGLGHDPAYAEVAIELVDRSEHKRRQSPPGVKVTRRAFGPRPPAANHESLQGSLNLRASSGRALPQPLGLGRPVRSASVGTTASIAYGLRSFWNSLGVSARNQGGLLRSGAVSPRSGFVTDTTLLSANAKHGLQGRSARGG